METSLGESIGTTAEGDVLKRGVEILLADGGTATMVPILGSKRGMLSRSLVTFLTQEMNDEV
jgi:hypothetical protein